MSMSAEDKKELFIIQAKSISDDLDATKESLEKEKNSPLYRLAVSQQQILTLLVQSQIGYEVAPNIYQDVSWEKVINDADETKSSGAAVGGRRRGISGGKSRKKRRRRGGKRTRRK